MSNLFLFDGWAYYKMMAVEPPNFYDGPSFKTKVSYIKVAECEKVIIFTLVPFSKRCAKLKFIYSEKATQFCEISTVDLTGTT